MARRGPCRVGAAAGALAQAAHRADPGQARPRLDCQSRDPRRAAAAVLVQRDPARGGPPQAGGFTRRDSVVPRQRPGDRRRFDRGHLRDAGALHDDRTPHRGGLQRDLRRARRRDHQGCARSASRNQAAGLVLLARASAGVLVLRLERSAARAVGARSRDRRPALRLHDAFHGHRQVARHRRPRRGCRDDLHRAGPDRQLGQRAPGDAADHAGGHPALRLRDRLDPDRRCDALCRRLAWDGDRLPAGRASDEHRDAGGRPQGVRERRGCAVLRRGRRQRDRDGAADRPADPGFLDQRC